MSHLPPAVATVGVSSPALGTLLDWAAAAVPPHYAISHVQGSLANVIAHAGVSSKALGPLLDWAAAVVPPRARPATPVFLFGTAGLRKLAAPQQGMVLRAAREALDASPFR